MENKCITWFYAPKEADTMSTATPMTKEDTPRAKITTDPDIGQKDPAEERKPVTPALSRLRRQTKIALLRLFLSFCLTLLLTGNILFPIIASELP